MKTAIACGGTGGHIFPGLAVAKILADRGHDVRLWMAGKEIEHEAMSEWGGKVVTVPARGFHGRNIFSHARTLGNLILVTRHCRHILSASRPDVLLAMGSYASIGPGLAASRLGVPLILHEANVIPGRAINMLARRADRIAVNFEETSFYLKRKGVNVTGMPLRPDLQLQADEQGTQKDDGQFTILIMGGSGGAHALNQICSQAVATLHRQGLDFEVIHLTGAPDEKMIAEAYTQSGVSAEVHAFHHDMGALYRRTNLAVCRAGASTCAELNAFAIPALLVPYPHAVKNHQMRNAEVMEHRGTANLIAQTDLSADWLTDYLHESIINNERLRRMHAAAMRHRKTDGAATLADLVEATAEE